MQSSFNLLTCVNNILPLEGDVQYNSNVIEADYEKILQSIDWQHEKIFLFGRWVLQPRLTAWYGDEGKDFTYSGLVNHPKSWTPELLAIKQQVETLTNIKFNSVLANYYRDGQDSMGWHQDNEKELGENPIIASVSLGATRRFHFRHKSNKQLQTIAFDLEHGSLLLMQGDTQNFWQHQVPKTKRLVDGRINLTFRIIR